MNVNVDGLAEAIREELEKYSEEVEAKVDRGIDEICQEAVEELKSNPNIPVKSGKYKNSFYFKNEAKGKGYKRNRIANKRYRLTHLLEFGHATRNGDRTEAFPHWADAEKKYNAKYEELLKKELSE